MTKTVKQQVVDKFEGYEEERRQRAAEERRQRDREWALWMDSRDSLFAILRNPGLAVRPSDRPPPTGAELLRIMIEERKRK